MNWEAFFWLAAMVVFLTVEASTVTLVSIWFAAGSLGAIVVALLGGDLMLQVAVFLLLAILLLLSLRGIVRRHITPRITKTNIDSIIGSTGIVLTPIDNVAALGQVRLNGVEWSARSTDGTPIPSETLVRVDRIEGVKVYVSPAEVSARV